MPRLILRSCQSLPRRAGCLALHPHPHRVPSPTISTTAAATASPEGLEIPSLNTTYAYRWLRDACTCPSCIHPSTQQKLHRTSDIPSSIAPENVEISDDGVYISWAGQDRHRSFFPRALLAAHVDPSALHSFHNDVSVALWPTASALLAASGPDLEVPYDELVTPRGLLRAITQLQRTGLLFLRDVPSADTSDANCEIRKLAARFAELRSTFYGDVWNVKAIDESRNIAYTSLSLGLHMDLQCVLHERLHFKIIVITRSQICRYLDSPPRFQVLHCLRNRVHGGMSLFVDAFAAAETLRVSYPPDFTRLVRTPVPFQYINDARHLHNARPTITLDPAGGIEPRVTAVSYSPPFQAPLPLNTPHEFYDALGRFAELVEEPTAVYAHQLCESEAVVFDNRRVLHGRTAFEGRRSGSMSDREAGGGPSRWLKGCYFEGDAMASHGRVLRDRVARGEI
jgi:gamma-butyrobetaine dioxygenase